MSLDARRIRVTFSGHSKMLTQLLPHLNGHLRLVQSEELANLFLTKRLDLMDRVSRSTAELWAVTCKGPRLGPSLVFCPDFFSYRVLYFSQPLGCS